MNLSSMRSRRRWPNVQSRGCRGNTLLVGLVLAYGSPWPLLKDDFLVEILPVCCAIAMNDPKRKKWQGPSAKVGCTIIVYFKIFVFNASC